MTCAYCLKEINKGITLQDKEEGVLNFCSLDHVKKYYKIEEGVLRTRCGDTVLFEEDGIFIRSNGEWFSDIDSFLKSHGYVPSIRK